MLAIILMNESICDTMLMPFVGLYVAKLQGVSPDEAGFASGFLVGVFMFGQVFSGKTWGWFSDVYGRKPAMQMGLLGTGVVMLFFGISPNLPIACLLRFLQGVGNGNLLVAKAMIPEVVPKAHEAKGYSLVSLTWGIGSLIGPVVGGVLYDPTRYESLGLSPTGMFGQYPALLPSLAIACYSFFALACSQFIPESNKDAKKPPSVREALGMGLNKVKKLGGGGGASTQRKHDIDTLTELEGGVDKATDKNAAPKAPKKKAFSFKEAFMLERTRLTLMMYMFISFAAIS
jgi:MFS family permease